MTDTKTPHAVSIPMPILTPRLELRVMGVADAVEVLAYKRDSWDDFLKWMVWVHPPAPPARTVGDEEKFCAVYADRFRARESINCLARLRGDGKLVATGGLLHCRWDVPMFTLGLSTRTGETGKGYATEVGAALCKYAFGALGAAKIAAFHAEGNEASRRTIEKLGFEKEGVLRRQHVLPSGIVDEHHYGLLDAALLPPLAVEWDVAP